MASGLRCAKPDDLGGLYEYPHEAHKKTGLLGVCASRSEALPRTTPGKLRGSQGDDNPSELVQPVRSEKGALATVRPLVGESLNVGHSACDCGSEVNEAEFGFRFFEDG